MDVNLLIECVKKHVYLYDLSDRHYSNIGLKTRAWESIAEDMDETSDAVRLKWKTVKDGYMKYRKQLVKASASESIKVAEYRWSRQLKFLDAHQVTRTPDTVPRTVLNKPEPSTLKELLLSNIKATPSSKTNLLLLKPLQHPELNPKKENSEEEMVNEMEMTKYDAIDYLFLSYAQTFKKFPLRQQAAMTMELANMFSKAELEISDIESKNPFSFVQVQSVMSLEGIDYVGSQAQWSPSSSCSNSEQTIT